MLFSFEEQQMTLGRGERKLTKNENKGFHLLHHMMIITGLQYDLLLIKILVKTHININLPLQLIKLRHVSYPLYLQSAVW